MAKRKIDTSLLDKAILFATKAHAGVERRGKDFPYIVHPLEAVTICATMTNDQEILAAAALHDVVEDTDVSLETIKDEFGPRVAQLVFNESDKDGPDNTLSWKERKLIGINKLRNANRDSKIVALGDKLSNIRAIARDFDAIGKEIWNGFNEKDPKEHEWRFRQLVDALSELKDFFAYQEFAFLVNYVFAKEDSNSYIETIEEKALSQKLAKSIQKSYLPKKYPAFENREDIDIYADIRNKDEVTGDFFDYFFIDDTHLVFYVAEVAERGIPAALVSSHLRVGIRNSASEGLKVKEILSKANLQLINDDISQTITSICLGILDTASGKLIMGEAGHSTPIIKENDNYSLLKLKKNLLLGYSEATEYSENEFYLEPGAQLVLYTKGLIYGLKRNEYKLLDLIEAIEEGNAQKTLETILDKSNNQREFDDDALCLVLKYNARRNVSVECELKDASMIDKYGGITLEMTQKELTKAGFEYADLVNVEINGKSQIMPILPDYRYLTTETTGLLSWPELDRQCGICTFSGNFAGSFGLNEHSKFPMKVKITMHEVKGYYAQFLLRDLHRSNDKNDYPHLSDEEFANFRCCNTTGLGENILYRGSTPVNPGIGRNYICDDALRKYGVKTIINMDNSLEELVKFRNFDKTYYSTTTYFAYDMNANYEMPQTIKVIGEMFKDMAKNKGPYYIHCYEGQDRTGFLCAVLEALMGATLKEILDDFMLTYYNYYGVEKGNMRYTSIVTNIIFELEAAFETDELVGLDLQDAANKYMKKVGLNDNEITALKANLR